MIQLLNPQELKSLYPLSHESSLFLKRTKAEISQILKKQDRRKILMIGPCSLHDENAFLEYALKMKQLSSKLRHFLLIIRFFYEKPRTADGWKGFLSDPLLDGSFRTDLALHKIRQLLLQMAELELPVACELLDPFSFPYFTDLISFGIIGARTSLSPIHRQLAALAPFPVAFKNTLDGDVQAAINAAFFARNRQAFLHLNEQGNLAHVVASGNPETMIVLRGSSQEPNFWRAKEFFKKFQADGVFCPILIDCAHGNSQKDLSKQKLCFQEALIQSEFIAGLMLESFLKAGCQPLKLPLDYGVSITDPCLGFEETETLLLEAEEQLEQNNNSFKELSLARS